MRIVRPTSARTALMVLLVFGLVLAPAGAVLAHNGTGGASSDYRIEITGWDGPHSGLTLRVIELGNRLQVQRTTASAVMVLGYEGEPYLRLDAGGVFENTNSPAHYLNLDRFASVLPPATASASAVPAWTRISTGATIAWHDHRAHWMSNVPRADVLADPGVERVVLDGQRIEFVVDGVPTAALIRVTWLPPPDRYVWFAAVGVIALAVAAVLVLVAAAERRLSLVVLAGAVATVLGEGTSTIRHALGAACIVAACTAIALRRPIVAVPAAVVSAAMGATRLEVFEHELIAGWPAGLGQRIAILIGLGLSLGVVASVIVGALGPSNDSRVEVQP